MNDGIDRITSVLVVEDGAVQRDHVVQLCRALGIPVVHEAANGVQALALLDRLDPPPSVMLIDLAMPVMDGVELIQHLRTRCPEMPFVIASSCDPGLVSSVVEMAREHGQRVTRSRGKCVTVDDLRAPLAACMALPAAAPQVRRAGLVEPERLAQAIAAGQVQPHFQPKADVRSGLIRGMEVLARWTDDLLGPVTPDRFIPVAESHGLIHSLTLSMLDQVLAQAAGWRAKGFKPTLAVNLSPGMLDSGALVGEIGDVVQRHGLRPEQLTFEITESSVVSYQGVSLGTLARLRMLGYGLSIDDYGTGFSSMQQLSRIPFTELKVDRSFVNGAHANENLRVMLQTSIDMARRLNITSVAEGVETAADWALLRGYGCDIAQGWLIGKAMPGDAIPAWLKAHQSRLPELRNAAAAPLKKEAR